MDGITKKWVWRTAYMNTNRDTFLIFLLCFATLDSWETIRRQGAAIRASQESITEVRQWIAAKFPPSKFEQMSSLQNVLDLGRRFGFFANHYGYYVPKWLGDAVKSVTGQDIRDGNPRLSNITFLYASLGDEARHLDYVGAQGFLDLGKPYYDDFPTRLSDYLDTVVQREISQLNSDTSPTPQ
jgi:hypothetical protein